MNNEIRKSNGERGRRIEDHVADLGGMIEIGSGANREISFDSLFDFALL